MGTRMTISLKVVDTQHLNAERACDILDSLLISLADGYFEGSNYKREYVRLFDFDWEMGDVDYVKIKFHDPDPDEVKRPRDDFEDEEEYEDYLEEVRQCGYPDLEYNYELKDACTEAEVLKYLSDTLKEVLNNHYPTVLNAFSRDSILELITVLNYGSQANQTDDDLFEIINTYSKYSHEMVNKTAEYYIYEDALFELIKKYHKAETKEEKDSTFNFITKKLKDLQAMNIEMMAIGLKQGIARKSLKKVIRTELPEINKLMNKYDIK